MFGPRARILSSDGLTDSIPDAAIADVLERHGGDPDASAEALVAAAVERARTTGRCDNITVCVVRVEAA